MTVLIPLVLLSAAPANEPKAATAPPSIAKEGKAPEFKVSVVYSGPDQGPAVSGELLFGRGLIYEIYEGSDEVVVIDRARKALRLLDLKRQVQTTLTFDDLDRGVAKLRAESRTTIAKGEKSAERADRVEAEIERDLLDPKFKATEAGDGRRVSLVNATVRVEAVGVPDPDPDPDRRTMLGTALVVGTKLRGVRDPETIPPFAQLDALSALVDARKLRPAELTFVFRIAGRPERYRWTYEVVPTLTPREREALARIDILVSRAASYPLDRYERMRPPRPRR